MASELAGDDLSGFFARYVSGADTVPIKECLARFGWSAYTKSYAAEAFLVDAPDATAAQRVRRRQLLSSR